MKHRPDFPVIIAGNQLSFVEFLQANGSPWRSALARARLPAEVPDPLDWLPALNVMRFVSDMARREGCPDLGVQAALFGSPQDVHPRLTRAVWEAPTLYAALVSLCRLGGLLGSHFRTWLQASDEQLFVCHMGSLPYSVPGADQGEYMRVVRLARLIRRFLGAAWRPTCVHLNTVQTPPASLLEYLQADELRPGMPFGMIAVPMRLVAQSMPGPFAERSLKPIEPTSRHEDLPNFVERLEAVLPSLLPDGHLTLDLVAEMVGASTRSLQRWLAENGTSHSQLLDRARFDRAQRLLLETDLSVTEIARLTGYSDSSNFSRAFRRLSGRSPAQFRRDRWPQA